MSALENFGHYISNRREHEDEASRKKISENQSSSSTLLNGVMVITIPNMNSDEYFVKGIYPVYSSNQSTSSFNQPVRNGRFYTRPQESATSFADFRDTAAHGAEISSADLVNTCETNQSHKISSQSSMSTSQNMIISTVALKTQENTISHLRDDCVGKIKKNSGSSVTTLQVANSNKKIKKKVSFRQPLEIYVLSSCCENNTAANFDPKSSMASSLQITTGSWKAIKESNSSQKNDSRFQACTLVSQNAIVTLNARGENNALSYQVSNSSLNSRNVTADNRAINVTLTLQMTTSQVAAKSDLAVLNGPAQKVNQKKPIPTFGQRNIRVSTNVEANSSHRPQMLVGTIMGGANIITAPRRAVSSRKCRILSVLIVDAVIISGSALIGAYSTEDEKKMYATAGCLIGVVAALLVDLGIFLSGCLS